MHIMRSDRRFPNKCPIPNCQSSFEYEKDLKRHIAIHNNDFNVCQYCPYRYNYTGNISKNISESKNLNVTSVTRSFQLWVI